MIFERFGQQSTQTFYIVKTIGTFDYRIVLPSTMRIHPGFNVSLLEQTADDQLEWQVIPPPLPPIKVEREEEYKIPEVLNSWIIWRRLKYMVKWKWYEQPDWLDARDVSELEAMDQFHGLYLAQPGPLLENA